MLCPDLAVLDQLAAQQLDEDSRRDVVDHVSKCPSCASALEEVRANLRLIPALDGEPAATVAPQADMVDGYHILEEIGRGGMGVVYRAQQRSPERLVALKLVVPPPGDEPDRSLRREAQALARLEHPSISTIYEAGALPDGRVFFAMELVEGRQLVRYADEEGLSLDGRVALFCELGRAVAHAHQRGVLHRDLKPSNILVRDDGTPKVLDFGLARMLESGDGSFAQSMQEGRVEGTIPYMSPETIRGDPGAVDVRSDVYSLGVVLYELLVGARPLTPPRNLVAAARYVDEELPPRPSSAKPALRGDLDTILLKSLAKRASERYASVAALVDDLERHRAGLPILAHPPTLGYQLRKLVARHRILFSTAAAAFVAAITIGIWMSVLYRLADSYAAQAEAKATHAQESNSLLDELLVSSDPHAARGVDYTVRELLDEFAATLPGRLPNQPNVEADLCMTMARAYRSLGLAEQAAPMLDRADEIWSAGGAAPSDGGLARERAWLLHDQGRYDEGSRVLRELIDASGGPGTNSPVVARAEYGLGDFARHAGDLEEAQRHAAAASATWEALGERGSIDWIMCRSLLAQVLQDRGALEDALAVLTEALELGRLEFGPRHVNTATLLHNTGYVKKELGDLDGAEELYRQALEMRAALHGDHPEVARTLNNLGELLRGRGQNVEAEALHSRALGMREDLLAPDHPDIAESLNNLSLTCSAQGDYESAVRHLERSIRILEATLPPAHVQTVTARCNLATLQRRSGDLTSAEITCRDALAIQASHDPGDRPATAYAHLVLAGIERDGGDLVGAESSAREALEMDARLYGRGTLQTATDLRVLGEIQMEAGSLEGAEATLREALEIYTATLGATNYKTAFARARVGQVLALRGDPVLGEAELVAAYELLLDSVGEAHTYSRAAAQALDELRR